MFPISALLRQVQIPLVSLKVGPYLAGGRVFRAEAGEESLWLADLTRFAPDPILRIPIHSVPFLPPLTDNLFLSEDGRTFYQLRTVERTSSCVLTDTPGFVPALVVYGENGGVGLFLGGREDPLEGLRILLDRVPAGDRLREAVFLPWLFERAAEGPLVVPAVRERRTDRFLRKLEAMIGELDHGREGRKDYRIDRGLEECSAFSEMTSFGRIDEQVASRLRSASPYRSGPLRILTVGPGRGRMERELKALFRERVSIDAFSLTDVVPSENRAAFKTVYLGNIDTHRLPSDYDLILSFFGTSYAIDSLGALEKVIDALRPGGEAFVIVTSTLKTGFESEMLSSAEAEFLRRNYGLVHELHSDPMAALANRKTVACIALRKGTGDHPPAGVMLDQAVRRAGRLRGIHYARERGLPAGSLADDEVFSRDQWEAFLEVAGSKGRVLDPRAPAVDLEAFRERLLAKCRRKAWEITKDGVALTTLTEAVECLWEWIEWQGILESSRSLR